MEEKILARIAALKQQQLQVQQEFLNDANRQLQMILAPYNAAIQELEALLQPEPEPEPEQPHD